MGNGLVFIEDRVDDVCTIIAPRLQNGLSVVPHYRMRVRGFVVCNEQVLDPGCVAVVHLSEKI